MRIPNLILKVMPTGSIVGDGYLSHSGRLLIRRLVAGFAALLIFGLGVALLRPSTWYDVFAGALLAWGVSILGWTAVSYRAAREEMLTRLEDLAKLDLLHARLNLISAKVGAPTLSLEDLDNVWRFRQQRIAHLTGLEEYGANDLLMDHQRGAAFWTQAAVGIDNP